MKNWKAMLWGAKIVGRIVGNLELSTNLENKIRSSNEEKNYNEIAEFLCNSLEANYRRDEEGVVTSCWIKLKVQMEYSSIKIGKKVLELTYFDEEKLINKMYEKIDPYRSRFSRICFEGTAGEKCCVAVKMGFYPEVSVIYNYA